MSICQLGIPLPKLFHRLVTSMVGVPDRLCRFLPLRHYVCFNRKRVCFETNDEINTGLLERSRVNLPLDLLHPRHTILTPSRLDAMIPQLLCDDLFSKQTQRSLFLMIQQNFKQRKCTQSKLEEPTNTMARPKTQKLY